MKVLPNQIKISINCINCEVSSIDSLNGCNKTKMKFSVNKLSMFLYFFYIKIFTNNITFNIVFKMKAFDLNLNTIF